MMLFNHQILHQSSVILHYQKMKLVEVPAGLCMLYYVTKQLLPKFLNIYIMIDDSLLFEQRSI